MKKINSIQQSKKSKRKHKKRLGFFDETNKKLRINLKNQKTK